MSKASTKKAKPKTKSANARTMVTLYDPDLAAIEKLRQKFHGLPEARYHSEVMRRAVILADEKNIGVSDDFIHACHIPSDKDGEGTKYAVVLRDIEAILDRLQKKFKMSSTSAALRLCLRSVAAL